MTFRRYVLIGLVIVLLVLAAVAAITWGRFHPRNVTPVVGPQGMKNRAYIENRSFGDLSFVLCASDWPHTLALPASIASVRYSEGEGDARVFWSADGSVVAVRKGSDPASLKFTEAYDFEAHEVLRYDSDRISALIASRGGIGPEQSQYPDGKDSY